MPYVTAREERSFRASGRAAARTGVMVSTHAPTFPTAGTQIDILTQRQLRGAAVDGVVVSDDPLPALRAAVADRDVREVVVVTAPHALEDTFHTDWASRAREVLGVPVLHIYAGDWRLG